MTTCLFPKLEECLRDLDIRKGIDFVQRAEANVQKVVFARDVSKAIDNPSSLMIAAIAVCVCAIRCRAAALCIVVDEWNICLVDRVENILSPGYKITPDADIIMEVRKTLAPCLKNHFELRGLFF